MSEQLTVAQKAEKYTKKLHDDFIFFLCEIWRRVNLPKPSCVQCELGKWLCSKIARRGVRGYRGMAKTWITIAYCAWRLYRNPNERILIVSQSRGHSEKSLFQLRQWITLIPFLTRLSPRPGQRDAATHFDIGGSAADRTPSVTAIGITGQLPGIRATLIVVDDVETKENTFTADQRQRLRDRVQEFENIAVVDAEIVYLGTPHHEDSLYDYLTKPDPDFPEREPYIFRAFPIYYPLAEHNIPTLAPFYTEDLKAGKAKPETPVWPEYHGYSFVESKKITKTTWLMQYMVITGVAEMNRYPLRLADLIVYPTHRDLAPPDIQWGQRDHNGPTRIEEIEAPGLPGDAFYGPVFVDANRRRYHGCKGYIDPAGRGKDEMAWAIIGQLNGYLYLKYCNGVHGGATTQNLDLIVGSLRDNNCTELAIETNFGGDMLIQLIKPVIQRFALKPGDNDAYPDGWNCAILRGANGLEGIHSSGQKEARIIDTLEPVCNQHRLVVDPTVAKDRELWYQFSRLTRDRNSLEHDDRVESVSGCVGLFADMLQQDSAKQEARQKEEDFQKRLDEFYAQFGQKPKPNSIFRHCMN